MSLQIGLSNKHANRLMKGKGFQLKHSELNGSGPHQFQLELNPAVHRRLNYAMTHGKGFRIPKSVVHQAMNLVKHAYRRSVPKDIRDGLSNIVNDGKKLYKNTGNIEEFLDDAKSLHKNLTSTYEKAKSVSGGKVGKGSQAAKDKMARVRAMRKISGGSTYAQRLARRTRNTFKPVAKAFAPVAKALAPIAPVAKSFGKKILKDVVKKGLPMIVTGALSSVGATAAAPAVNAALTPALNGVIDKQIDGLGVLHLQPRIRSSTSNIRGGPPLPIVRRRGGSMIAP